MRGNHHQSEGKRAARLGGLTLLLLLALLCLAPTSASLGARASLPSMELPGWGDEESEETRLGLMEEHSLWPMTKDKERFLNTDDEARIETEKEREGETVSPTLLPANWREAYFGQLPAAMITDPQNVLTAAEKSELAEGLERHAHDSDLPVYVLIFSGGQRLPAAIDPLFLYRTWFPEGGAVLVFYYHGEPERTSMNLSLGRQFLIPDEKTQSVLSPSISAAHTAENHVVQLGHFLDKLISQLYWLELESRTGQAGFRAAQERAQAPGLPVAKATSSNGRERGELIPLQPNPMRKQLATASLSNRKLTGGRSAWIWLSLAPLLVLAGAGGVAVARKKKRLSPKALIFIDQEVYPRLGAPYSGGSSVTMSFRPRA